MRQRFSFELQICGKSIELEIWADDERSAEAIGERKAKILREGLARGERMPVGGHTPWSPGSVTRA